MSGADLTSGAGGAAATAGMAAAGPIGWAGLAASFLSSSGVLTPAPMTPDNTLSGQLSYSFEKAFSPIYNKPFIDLENPWQLAALVGLAVLGAVVWVKTRKK